VVDFLKALSPEKLASAMDVLLVIPVMRTHIITAHYIWNPRDTERGIFHKLGQEILEKVRRYTGVPIQKTYCFEWKLLQRFVARILGTRLLAKGMLRTVVDV